MYMELMAHQPKGNGLGCTAGVGVIRKAGDASVADIAADVSRLGIQSLVFLDESFFEDQGQGITMCREMRANGMNVLWSAYINVVPSGMLLREMRLAGCQHIEFYLEAEEAEAALHEARSFGFDIRLLHSDGTPYALDRIQYTVAEREAISGAYPDLHAAQFDLAVAYYKEHRFREVMLPLGKAMTLNFPMNELCLNLLACLSAAKHYPDMAAGLLEQAKYGFAHPVVDRNQDKLQSWLENGGDVKGVRLLLEPANLSLAQPVRYA